jgi:mRNA interferase RelE/StbE
MWQLLYSQRADRQLRKLDPGVRRVVVAWLNKNIDGCDDPRATGKGLTAGSTIECSARFAIPN